MEHTPGPWSVRYLKDRGGEVRDCFVTAPDVNGFTYDAEILGDDEYRDGIDRKIADCKLIAAAPAMLEIIKRLHDINGYISLPVDRTQLDEVTFLADRLLASLDLLND